MFDQVEVRALTGPLKDIQGLVLKPLMRCLGCVLKVVVLLEGESLPQSGPEQVFIKDLYFALFIFASSLTCLSQSLPQKNIPTA